MNKILTIGEPGNLQEEQFVTISVVFLRLGSWPGGRFCDYLSGVLHFAFCIFICQEFCIPHTTSSHPQRFPPEDLNYFGCQK